jgi:hypothetical protein
MMRPFAELGSGLLVVLLDSPNQRLQRMVRKLPAAELGRLRLLQLGGIRLLNQRPLRV